MNVRRSILLGVLLAVVVVLLLMIWVVVDGTFVVRGDMVNLVENPMHGWQHTLRDSMTLTGN